MNPTEYCETIVRKIKLANLHYIVNENPFSLQINIRKKFISNQKPLESLVVVNETSKKDLKQDIEHLKKNLDAKTLDLERCKVKNEELMCELTNVSDELFETKIELTKQHSHAKETFAEVKKT